MALEISFNVLDEGQRSLWKESLLALVSLPCLFPVSQLFVHKAAATSTQTALPQAGPPRNPKKVPVICHFCGKCMKYWGRRRSTSSQEDKTFQPFPLLYPCCCADLVRAVQDGAGLGWARLLWCCQARLELRMLCCCLNVLALLGVGVFQNRVLLQSSWVPVCLIFCKLLFLWWFKVFSLLLKKAALGWILHLALHNFC